MAENKSLLDRISALEGEGWRGGGGREAELWTVFLLQFNWRSVSVQHRH